MNPLERNRVAEQAMQDQRQIFDHLIRDGVVPRLVRSDLTMAQLRALLTVAHRGPLAVGQLGGILGVGKPTASLLIDALVGHNLVERNEDPVDRRRTLVRISQRGRELVDEARQGRQERLLGWLAELDETDLLALARGLRALLAVASAASRAESADPHRDLSASQGTGGCCTT